MSVELISQSQETSGQMTPRDHLVVILKDEAHDSLKFEGIEDYVKLDLIIGRLQERFKRRRISYNPESKRDILLSDDNRKRKELIRKSRIAGKEDGGVSLYSRGFSVAQFLLGAYVLGAVKHQELSQEEIRRNASFALLHDLRNIRFLRHNRDDAVIR